MSFVHVQISLDDISLEWIANRSNMPPIHEQNEQRVGIRHKIDIVDISMCGTQRGSKTITIFIAADERKPVVIP
jgi:hypothetical protein